MNFLVFVLVPVGIFSAVMVFLSKGLTTAVMAPNSPTTPAAPPSEISPEVAAHISGVPAAVLTWRDLAAQYAEANAVLDPEEILAIIWNESSGNPRASNPRDPSWGLMGVTAPIAAAYGGFDASDSSWHEDPEKNISIGSAFLADLKNKYADAYPTEWPEPYNEGETRFRKGSRVAGYAQAFFEHLAALKGSAA